MAVINRLDDGNLLISPSKKRQADLCFIITNNVQSGISIKLDYEKSNSFFQEEYERYLEINGGIDLSAVLAGFMRNLNYIAERDPFSLEIRAKNFSIPKTELSSQEEYLSHVLDVYNLIYDKYENR
jgi:hypothetical protein